MDSRRGRRRRRQGFSKCYLVFSSESSCNIAVTASQARAVNSNIDGDIMMTGYITGLKARFGGLTLSSRSTLSRTIFLATYSPLGSIRSVKEAASCVIGSCDVIAVTSDETGTVLTGVFTERITFGTKQVCSTADPTSCITSEASSINLISGEGLTFDLKKKSTGSGMARVEYCWVAKFDKKGDYIWHKYCNDKRIDEDQFLLMRDRKNTVEQTLWAKKAQEFFDRRPTDTTGLLAKDMNYETYAKRRVPFGV